MADNLAGALEFGPRQKMELDAEWIQALTAGDKIRMEELLSRQDPGAGNVHPRANGQVAIDVHGVAPACFLGVSSHGNTALHLVASRGHAALATLICERAPSLVATRNKCLDTPLHCAAKAGHKEVAAVLLSKMQAGAEEKAALLAKNETGATALYEAVRHGRADVVDLLMMEAPGLASVATDRGVSPLYLAAMTGSEEIVRALLRPSQNGTPSPASFSGPEGRTALHAAATHSKEIAEAILGWEPQGPALLAKVDSSGSTPLHFAALYEEVEIVELFLNSHASLGIASISNSDGSFPVHIAAMVGETRIIDMLINTCPNYYEQLDEKGRNLLHRAVEHGQTKVVCHICQNDRFVMLLNATDSQGDTPLHLAVKYGYPRILCLLLETVSVEMDVTNKDGLTAHDLTWRALSPSRTYYFLDPNVIVYNCLYWSGAPITLDGVHPLTLRYMEDKDKHKPAEEDTANEKDNNTGAGAIASVLIATVAFAAAFTVPGGFVADDHARAGTAILARRFAFRAFVISDTMAFVSSIVATCFLVYGGTRWIPRNHRRWYNLLASGLVPVGAQFLIGAFAFGFHVVLGEVNRWLIVFVYMVSLASLLFCFPGIWAPLHLGLGKAVWRRAGWRGLVNIRERPSSLPQLLLLFTHSVVLDNIRRPLFVLLISATFLVAMALTFALPDY